MPFEKGKEKTGGRTKGTPNKISQGLREKILQFTTDSFDSIINDFKLLEPKEKMNLYIKMLQFVLPKANGSNDFDTSLDEHEKQLIEAMEFHKERERILDEMIKQATEEQAKRNQ